MRLLFITQKVDRGDWLLGYTHGWLQAIAARVEHLTVICLGRGEVELPANVELISLGKEAGVSKLWQAIRFITAVARSLAHCDTVFAHMSPIFAIGAAPFVKWRRARMVLWYTHRHVDLKLRLATWLSDAVATASAESFRLRTNKRRVLGHGIDSAQFQFLRDPESPPLIVSVGRLSPIKRYEMLIDAIRMMKDRGIELRCVIIGAAPLGEQEYARSLKAYGSGIVEFLGSVPHREVSIWYSKSTAATNLCPTGGIDKAVIEAMLCGCPIVVANESFRALLGEEATPWLVSDARQLAQVLADVVSDPVEAQSIAKVVRGRALAGYALDGFIDRLLKVLKGTD